MTCLDYLPFALMHLGWGNTILELGEHAKMIRERVDKKIEAAQRSENISVVAKWKYFSRYLDSSLLKLAQLLTLNRAKEAG